MLKSKDSPPEDLIPTRVKDKPWIYVHRPVEEKKTNNSNVCKGNKDSNNKEETTSTKKRKVITVGKWMLFNDKKSVCEEEGMTKHDAAWQTIKKLVESGGTSVFGAKCSTAWGDGVECRSNPNGLICCYTNDYTDKHDVRKAANEIRQVFTYGCDMYYKTDEDTYANKYRHLGNKVVTTYRHTIENNMYERDSIDPQQWKLVEFEENDNDMLKSKESPPEDLIPTRVKDKAWIYVHRPDEEKKTNNSNTCKGNEDSNNKEATTSMKKRKVITVGKWMLFNDKKSVCEEEGMTKHDTAWQTIKKLVESGGTSVFVAKCSTALGDRVECRSNTTGLICCYTNDYTDKQDVKKAADEIRRAFTYGCDMYYKTDKDTYANKYRHLGNKVVSKYRHTIENNMYERDSIDPQQWKLVEFEDQ